MDADVPGVLCPTVGGGCPRAGKIQRDQEEKPGQGQLAWAARLPRSWPPGEGLYEKMSNPQLRSQPKVRLSLHLPTTPSLSLKERKTHIYTMAFFFKWQQFLLLLM